jgi:hypothetical protein
LYSFLYDEVADGESNAQSQTQSGGEGFGTRAPPDPTSDLSHQPQFARHRYILPAHPPAMPLSPSQITAANEVINILCVTPAGPRAKRKLGEMFMELVDKDDLPEYYEV